MKKRYSAIIIAFLLLGVCILRGTAVHAQKTAGPLRVGERLPEIAFENVLNTDGKPITPSSFRGKWLLLDFWSPSCVSCLKAFPHLQSLQARFTDSLQIVSLCFSWKKQDVIEFLANRKRLQREITLPVSVYETMDNSWIKLFPTDGFPLVIWIDPDGKLVAQTASDAVTEKNIAHLLAKSSLPNVRMKARQAGYDRNIPLLTNGNGGPDTAFRYRSLITPYIDSIPAQGILRQRTANYTRLFIANESIVNLVKAALLRGKSTDVFSKKVVIEATDPTRFQFPPRDSNYYNRLPASGWCYDLIVPPAVSFDEAWDWMLSDLTRYFNITTSVEKRKITCWVLRPLQNSGAYLTKGGAAFYRQLKESGDIQIENKPPAVLAKALNRRHTPWIVTEGEWKGNIDVALQLSPTFTLPELNEALRPFGLQVRVESRELDVIVIKENQYIKKNGNQ